MSTHDFTVKRREEKITFGVEGESIAFDISFIPSDKGYEIQQALSSRQKGETISPEIMAKVILIVAKDQVENISEEWIISHSDYKTLNKAFLCVLNKAYGRAEKNE